MRTITVVLGGKEFQVTQQPMRDEAAWRKQLQEKIAPLLELARSFGAIEFNGPADVATFIERFAPLLLDAPDTMLQLLFDYSPELAIRAEEIETTAYSDEVMEALKAVLALAYPFGQLARMFTPSSLSALNGAALKPTPTI